MKRMLYIAGLFCMLLLFGISHDEVLNDSQTIVTSEAIMKEKNSKADMQHRLEMISNDLKNSNFRTPRRTIQLNTNTQNANSLYNYIRTLQEFRMKGANQLQKISEYVAYCQTSNYSTLLCRMRYHVYALRKIII